MADGPSATASESTGDAAPAVRPPPRVVRVPQPYGFRLEHLLLVILAGVAVAMAVAMAVVGSQVGWVFAGIALALLLLTWLLWARNRARAIRTFAAHPELASDPVVQRIGSLWRFTGEQIDAVPDALAAASPGDAPAAVIVCFGLFPVPEVGALHFEPHIITATELLWRKLIFMPFVVALLAFWLLQGVGVIPNLHVELSGFTYFFVVGGVALVTWVWRSGIRPTYFRMAPGIVQVMEFGLRRRRPVIRSYPMEAGTTVVLSGDVQNVRSVTLLRDARPGGGKRQKDVLPLAQLRRPKEALEHLWQALLSTAPIPRLSDEALIE